MLNHAKIFIILGVTAALFSCNNINNEKPSYLLISKKLIGTSSYFEVLTQINDSLNYYVSNKLIEYEAEYSYEYKLDSLICFNKNANRLIGCRHLYVNIPNAIADDLQFMLGEKIKDKWYFYKGASIVIPREMVKGHDIHKPLSYKQLHEIALKEVYSGYLNDKDEINESWFKAYFDDDMMSFKKYKNKEEYNKLVISQCKGIWAERYLPYTNESFKFKYDKRTKSVDINFKLQTFDSVYCQPILYKVIYQHKGMENEDNACGLSWCDEIDWNKQKYAHVQLKNVPENSDVTIKIQVVYFPTTKSPVMGPFIFKTNSINL